MDAKQAVPPTTPALSGRPDVADVAAVAARDEGWSAWRTWAAVFALAMLFGLMEAAQLRLGSSVLGAGIPIGVALARVLPFWALAACVLPVAVVVGRRLHLQRFVLRPNVPALTGAALGFAVLAMAGRAAWDPRTGAVLRPSILQLFQTYFALDLLAYTAFVGTLYAFHYYREGRRREITASKLQASLAEARLNGLEARVDPEFLLSTLGDISTLAKHGQQRPVLDSLVRLSEVLRAALGNERPEEVRLSHELDLLEGYLRVSGAPSSEAVTVVRHVAPDALDALVPRGVLAPVVDRVVLPGPDGRTRHQLTVRGEPVNDTLRLEVQAAAGHPGDRAWSEPGALDDVRDRLTRLYGEAHAMRISPAEGSGVVVSMTLPFRRALAGEERAAP